MGKHIPMVCLGSGAALTQGRQWNSLLIDNRILLELPPTAMPQIYRLGISPDTIENIFISHVHADHMFGLPFLLLEYCVRSKRSIPLHLIGPVGLEETTEKLCALAWPDLVAQGFRPNVPLVYTEIDKEGTYRAGELSFTAIPMRHFNLDAFGYRFAYAGKTFAYTGDTGECDALDRLLGGVDVAILELTHPHPSDDPGHLDVEEVTHLTEWLKKGGTAVFATHMSGEPEPIDGLTLCEDGTTYLV